MDVMDQQKDQIPESPPEVAIEDLSDMPPLEDIDSVDQDQQQQKLKTGAGDDDQKPKKEKNIVIPEDSDDDEKAAGNDDGYMDILNNGDLRKKTVKKGNSVRPQRGSKVVIRLETRLYEPGKDENDVGSGKIISAETFDRFTMDLGDNDLHQGLDLLIPLMELNEQCRAIIKPRFGYGPQGNADAGIPGDATLDCIIELLEIITESDNVYGEDDGDEAHSICNTQPLDERLRTGNYKKTRGNLWFERGEYSLAIQCYRGALKYLDANNEELKKMEEKKNSPDVADIDELVDKRAQTFNNLAAAQMKLQAFEPALRSVRDSLMLRPENVKALFREARLLTEKGRLDEAVESLKKAAKIDPKSEAVAVELDRLNKILAKQLKEEKELYRRMMQVKNETSVGSGGQNGKQKNNSDDPNRRDYNKEQSSSIWSRFRWPIISLSMATIAAIGVQVFRG